MALQRVSHPLYFDNDFSPHFSNSDFLSPPLRLMTSTSPPRPHAISTSRLSLADAMECCTLSPIDDTAPPPHPPVLRRGQRFRALAACIGCGLLCDDVDHLRECTDCAQIRTHFRQFEFRVLFRPVIDELSLVFDICEGMGKRPKELLVGVELNPGPPCEWCATDCPCDLIVIRKQYVINRHLLVTQASSFSSSPFSFGGTQACSAMEFILCSIKCAQLMMLTYEIFSPPMPMVEVIPIAPPLVGVETNPGPPSDAQWRWVLARIATLEKQVKDLQSPPTDKRCYHCGSSEAHDWRPEAHGSIGFKRPRVYQYVPPAAPLVCVELNPGPTFTTCDYCHQGCSSTAFNPSVRWFYDKCYDFCREQCLINWIHKRYVPDPPLVGVETNPGPLDYYDSNGLYGFPLSDEEKRASLLKLAESTPVYKTSWGAYIPFAPPNPKSGGTRWKRNVHRTAISSYVAEMNYWFDYYSYPYWLDPVEIKN